MSFAKFLSEYHSSLIVKVSPESASPDAHVPQKVCSTSSCGAGGCVYLADWGWSS